jgi:hypothetical protein
VRWVAPTENDTVNEVQEWRLWEAADQFQAKSGLNAGKHSAEARFAQHRAQKERLSRCRLTSRTSAPAPRRARTRVFAKINRFNFGPAS